MGAPREGPSGQASGLIAVNAGGGLGVALPELDVASVREEGPLAGAGEEWELFRRPVPPDLRAFTDLPERQPVVGKEELSRRTPSGLRSAGRYGSHGASAMRALLMAQAIAAKSFFLSKDSFRHAAPASLENSRCEVILSAPMSTFLALYAFM